MILCREKGVDARQFRARGSNIDRHIFVVGVSGVKESSKKGRGDGLMHCRLPMGNRCVVHYNVKSMFLGGSPDGFEIEFGMYRDGGEDARHDGGNQKTRNKGR